MEESEVLFPDVSERIEHISATAEAEREETARNSDEPNNPKPPQEKMTPWKLSNYTIDRTRVISKGSLGLFFFARHAEGSEVIAWSVRSQKGTLASLVRCATKLLVKFANDSPNTVSVIDSFACSGDEESPSAIIVLKFDDMENAEKFFLDLQQSVDEKTLNRSQTLESPAPRGNVTANVLSEAAETSVTPCTANLEVKRKSEELNSFGFSMVAENMWRVKGYVIDTKDILGRGRFGTVYGGLHEPTGSSIAAKVLKGPLRLKEKLENETRELKRLGGLNHPNILRLHETLRQLDPVEKEVTLVHIFELCPGGDLKEFLARHDPLSERQAQHLMRQLVDCLCVLKTNCVMHRDLKPANILLSSKNVDEAILKVADWGMAKSNRAEDFSKDCALFESAVGTVAYMSPERLMRDSYDFQAEVWAAGVIMYELLFARHPYVYPAARVRTPEELLNAITHAEELEMTGRARERETDGGQSSHSPPSHEGHSRGMNEKDEQAAPVHLSHECYELMRRMLDVDSKRRYTIEQVAAHPWLHVGAKDVPLAVPEGTKVPALSSTLLASLSFDTAATKASTTAGTITASFVEPSRQTHRDRNDATEKDTEATLTSPCASLPSLHASPPPAVPKAVRPFSSPGPALPSLPPGHAQLRHLPNRPQIVYHALHSYLRVLRYDVIEEETDPGRALVLLAYAWDLLRMAVRAAHIDEPMPARDNNANNNNGEENPNKYDNETPTKYKEETPTKYEEETATKYDEETATKYDEETLTKYDEETATKYKEETGGESAWLAQRVPPDVRHLERFVQDAAQRQLRRLPAAARRRPLGHAALAFSTASIDLHAHAPDLSPRQPAQTFTLSSSSSMYPTAQTLMFRRAVALVRGAATEELMLCGDSVQERMMNDAEEMAQLHAGRRHAYEQAIGILRVLLQQAVVPRQANLCLAGASGAEAQAEDGVQVVTVALVPFADEADQRTVQALLHSVEKHYLRTLQTK